MAKYTKETVAEMLEQFYKENKRAPLMNEMNSAHNLPTYVTVRKVMGMTPTQYIKKKHPAWKQPRNAVRSVKKRLSNEDIIQQYRDFYQKHHRAPNAKECKERGLVYAATFKRAVGQPPATYFRSEKAAALFVKGQPEQSMNQPFVLELLSRLGTSVDDLSKRTNIPAKKIEELLSNELPEEFRQLCSIAKELEVPIDIFFPKNGNV